MIRRYLFFFFVFVIQMIIYVILNPILWVWGEWYRSLEFYDSLILNGFSLSSWQCCRCCVFWHDGLITLVMMRLCHNRECLIRDYSLVWGNEIFISFSYHMVMLMYDMMNDMNHYANMILDVSEFHLTFPKNFIHLVLAVCIYFHRFAPMDFPAFWYAKVLLW